MSDPFGWLSPVFFDELDLNGYLHNSRFIVHVERRLAAGEAPETIAPQLTASNVLHPLAGHPDGGLVLGLDLGAAHRVRRRLAPAGRHEDLHRRAPGRQDRRDAQRLCRLPRGSRVSAATRPDQVTRSAALGVVAVPQGRFASELGDGMLAAVGPERHRRLYRQRSLLEAGMTLPGSSDRPVVRGASGA